MLYVATWALGALAGFLIAVLMGVTVVGVCRFRKTYKRFFERFRTLGVLAAIREVAALYLIVLDKFLGSKTGFKQPGIRKTKFVGWYLEHLLLIYWVVGTILVLSFRPVDSQWESSNSLLQAGAFALLLTVNVLSDAISFLWTKRCIAYIVKPRAHPTALGVAWLLVQDILVAVGLMIAVQLISNGLYAVQIGRPGEVWPYMKDINTAFKPYAPVDPRFSHLQFPGQLLITCTTYIPSLFFYFACLLIVSLSPFAKLAYAILYLLKLDRRSDGCTQIGFIACLLAVGTAGIGCFAVFCGGLLILLAR